MVAHQRAGRVGEAARNVAALFHPHSVKEEEYALPEMLAEHRRVVAALEKLAEAGQVEQGADAERFAEKLHIHAETEEQVLDPAAVLLGEYAKARRGG
jgi:hypothetical protein